MRDRTTVRPATSDRDYDDELVALTHPTDWSVPNDDTPYTMVVVGGGTAGLVTAAASAILGARVALVERHRLGGDCLHAGCVPSKALLSSARAIAAVRRAADHGVHVSGDIHVDFPAVMQRLRRLRAHIGTHDAATRFRDLGVDILYGDARFVGPREIDVEGRRLRFSRACIATGTRPILPPIPGLADVNPLTAVHRREDGIALVLTDANGETTVVVDRVLVAVGRAPVGADLDLDAAEVAWDDRRGVIVNDHLRTSNRRIYAAGDVCSPYRFTHAADAMARIVVRNAFFPGRHRVSGLKIPWCTYTDPEVAHIGVTADDAAGASVTTIDLADVDRAIVDETTNGFLKVVHRKGRVVSATLVAPHAGDMIGEIVLAIAPHLLPMAFPLIDDPDSV